MVPVMLQAIPSFRTIFSQNVLFNFATCKKIIVIEQCSIVHHHDKTFFPNNCRYLFIVQRANQVKQQKLDIICFTYQIADCLYAHFMPQLKVKNVAESKRAYATVQTTMYFTQTNKAVD